MRKIDFIGIHCTASDDPKDDSYQAVHELHTGPKLKLIDWGKYKNVPCRNWIDIGYNFLILKDGTIYHCRPMEIIGAHIKGHNKNSISIALSGDIHFTKEQRISFTYLVDKLISQFNLDLKDLVAHYELDSSKTCPNFNPIEFYLGS